MHILYVFERLRGVQRQLHESECASESRKKTSVFSCTFSAALVLPPPPSSSPAFATGCPATSTSFRSMVSAPPWARNHSLKSHEGVSTSATLPPSHAPLPDRHTRNFSKSRRSFSFHRTPAAFLCAAAFRCIAAGISIRRQCLVENLPGQLLQLRHEGSAWKFVTMPSELLDSNMFVAAVP